MSAPTPSLAETLRFPVVLIAALAAQPVSVTRAQGLRDAVPLVTERVSREEGRADHSSLSASPTTTGQLDPVDDGTFIGYSRLVHEGIVGTPQASADGQHVVFVALEEGHSRVIMGTPAGRTVLADDGDPKFKPRISADGSTVVWAQQMKSEQREDFDPMMWRAGQVTRLSDRPTTALYMDVSGDGSRIVWDENREENQNLWDVVLWTEEGETVLDPKDSTQEFPKISADGSTVVWTEFVRSGGRAVHRLRRWQEGRTGRAIPGESDRQLQPVLSTDGSKIVYIRQKGRFDEAVCRAVEGEDGVEVEVLAPGPGFKNQPTASADTSVAAWGSIGKPGTSWNIELYDGETVRQVTDMLGNELFPTMSADGHTIFWENIDVPEQGVHRVYRFRWALTTP